MKPNRKTILAFGAGLLIVCSVLGVVAFVWLNNLGQRLTNLAVNGQCPPIVLFEDVNGNGSQDEGETSFSPGSSEYNSGGLTFYDENNQKLGEPASPSTDTKVLESWPIRRKPTVPLQENDYSIAGMVVTLQARATG